MVHGPTHREWDQEFGGEMYAQSNPAKRTIILTTEGQSAILPMA